MQLRILVEPQLGPSYDDLLAAARTAEECGFDAFFRSEHYLAFPPDHPMGGRATGASYGLPGPTDAWVTLAGLARDTKRIRLGTLVSPVTFRPPAALAISVAQVDAMSGGRVELGLGTGWYEAEHHAYGIPFPTLGERFELFSVGVAVGVNTRLLNVSVSVGPVAQRPARRSSHSGCQPHLYSRSGAPSL